jgi:rhomboid protease GluP
MQESPPSLAEVYRSNWRGCAQHGLALEAAGITYQIQERSDGFAIVVAAVDGERARAEIEEYAADNPVPAAVAAVVLRGGGWVGVAAYAVVLAVLTALQQNDVFANNWLDAGRMNAGLVRSGELWRTVTALTLHVDIAHLVGNILIGGLIGLFAGQVLGSGLAWMSILLAGAAGNLLSASFRPAGHTSIGASTAVFAAVGILAAYEWTRRRQLPAAMLVRYAPIVGGVVLLSYLGTGGEQTDVVSHMTGFLCGLLLGTAYGKLGPRITFRPATQLALGGGAIALMALSWVFALA